MKTITDLQGRKWDIHMTLRHARVIESRLGVNVLSPETTEQGIMELVLNPSKMIEILWILIEKPAEEKGISRDEFDDSMDGQSLLAAEKAVGEEMLFFIQSVAPSRAKLWTAILAKSRKVAEISITKLEEFLDSQEIDKMVEREMTTHIEAAITTLRETTGKASGS